MDLAREIMCPKEERDSSSDLRVLNLILVEKSNLIIYLFIKSDRDYRNILYLLKKVLFQIRFLPLIIVDIIFIFKISNAKLVNMSEFPLSLIGQTII